MSDTCRLLVSDYLVSIVVSDRFAIRCRIDIAAPVPLAIDQVPVLYEMPQDKDLADKYAQDVKEAVSERFFFFDELDDKKDKKPDQNAEKPKHDYEYVPALYCGYCGGIHDEGECPLMDESQCGRYDLMMTSIFEERGFSYERQSKQIFKTIGYRAA